MVTLQPFTFDGSSHSTTSDDPLQPFATARQRVWWATVTTPAPMKLEHVIARAMAELRLERDWTQADLAWRMTVMGISWAPNRVSQLESLRRPISLFEVAALSWVFEVPVTRLLPGEQDIEAPDGQTIVPLSHIRAALTGDVTVQKSHREAGERQKAYLEEIRRVAKGLGLEPKALEWLARELFGRSFIDEREARLGNVADLTKHSARTKRGHATRALVGEIQRHIDREGIDQVVKAYRQYQLAQHEKVLAMVKSQQADG